MDAVAHGEPGERRLLAVTLASVAGFVDAVGFVTLNLFSAHMSGNSARLGAYLGRGWFLRAAPSAFAILVFLIGIGVGTLVMERAWRAGRRSPAAAILGAEAALLVALALWGGQVAVHGRIPATRADVYYPLAGFTAIAMGLQASTLQRISGRTVRTTFISGMLTNLAEEVVGYVLGPAQQPAQPSYLRGELGLDSGTPSLRRIRLLAGIWFAYAGGAVLGSYLHDRWSLACLIVPVTLLVGVITVELRWPVESPGRVRRSGDRQRR